MLLRKWKEKKVIGIALVTALCITLILATTIIFAQHKTENSLADMVNDPLPEEFEASHWNDATLYRDIAASKEIGLIVCEKFQLDYDTVTLGEMPDEWIDYDYSLDILTNHGDSPLLESQVIKTEDMDGPASLEMFSNDLHAFYGSKPIIENLCKEIGLDPIKGKIKDLTVDQIVTIMQIAYATSDHGK